MQSHPEKLLELISSAEPKLKAISEKEFSAKSNPVKWSKKEILGHLIDSAVNNLKRFTEAQFKDDFTVEPYSQDALVAVNHYQSKDKKELINLFMALNKQIVEVTAHAEPKVFEKILQNNQLKNTHTYRWMLKDYIAHMKHHFNQIFN